MKDQPELPCYLRIADELRAKLKQLPLGAPFETEQALTKTYGVSRGTIRQALDVLEREGLVARSQGRGSFRSQPNKSQPLLQLSGNIAGTIRQIGTAREVAKLSITLTSPPARIADMLKIARGTKVRKFSRVRIVNGEPYAYCVGYARADLVPQFFKRDFETSLPDLLQNTLHLHIESRGIEIFAAAADRAEADALKIPEGSPVLKVCFLCHSYGGEPMLVDVLTFPPTQALQFECLPR